MVVPRAEIAKAPKLMIKIEESIESSDPQCFLEINAQGMVGGHRQKQDGCTIIGTRGSSPHRQPLNDFDIGSDTSPEDKRHLVIKYTNLKYYLRDLGDGNGTFVKID